MYVPVIGREATARQRQVGEFSAADALEPHLGQPLGAQRVARRVQVRRRHDGRSCARVAVLVFVDHLPAPGRRRAVVSLSPFAVRVPGDVRLAGGPALVSRRGPPLRAHRFAMSELHATGRVRHDKDDV